jgi:hypothetical protein
MLRSPGKSLTPPVAHRSHLHAVSVETIRV